MQKDTIPINRGKLALWGMSSILFGGIGFIAFKPLIFQSTSWITSLIYTVFLLVLWIVNIGSIISVLRRLFDPEPAIRFKTDGLIENANAYGIGLIKWEDIIALEEIEISNVKHLVIFVHYPNAYIQKARFVSHRKAYEANYVSYGSPVVLNSSILNIKVSELRMRIEERLQQAINLKLEHTSSNP